MNFKFEEYQQPFPPGVKLPEIKIQDKYYDDVDCKRGDTHLNFLRHLCMKGIREKGIDKFDNVHDYYARLKEEISVLNELGFIDYILLNWDILNFCKEKGITTGAGRGSAAGSLVLYTIGVTNIDPIKYDLYFERFVSRSRARKIEVDGEVYLDGSLLADIDNDIAYDRRPEVLEYIEEKYRGRTSKILTINTLSSKLCIRECGKIVSDMSEVEVNDLSALIPKKYGKVVSLNEAMEESGSFKKRMEKSPELFKIARKLEGLHKNFGVHPSGIAISFYPLEDIMPLQLTNEGELVSGYEMNDVASLSVKFDILGVRTLSVVVDVLKQIGIKSMYDINIEDQTIYAALQVLETPQGLFQIEAETNYRVCQQVKPRNLEQLSAVVAIGRPGALDFKDSYSTYVRTGDFQSVHQFFDDVLSYTGGIPLYQEQLMKMANKVGFSLDDSEQIRRIVGKKKVDQMPAWKNKIDNMIKENNLPAEVGEVLWKVAEDSANYSFNKSHALSYAYLAAITTYLKFKYPKEFFLALLKMARFEPDTHEEIAKVSQELPLFGIELLPPDLNLSGFDFSIDEKNIRYGLNSIKGIKEKVMQGIIDFRDEKFDNKFDIFISAKQCGINIGVLSALIQAGTLDSFVDKDRCRLVLEAQSFNILTDREKRNIVEWGQEFDYDVLEAIHELLKENRKGDDGRPFMTKKRFGTFMKKYDPYKKIYLMNRGHIKFANWYFETKLLGYSYSHSLRDVFKDTEFSGLKSAYEVSHMSERRGVKFVGVVTEISRATARSGHRYARIHVQDESGSVTGLFMDSDREARLQNFLDSGKKLPKKEDIVILSGATGDNVVFVDRIQTIEDKIYMKLSQLK